MLPLFVTKIFEISSVFSKEGRGGYLIGVSFLSMSRVFNTVALFLPLKVLIVFSSSGVPEYFDFLAEWISEDVLIASLVIATPLAYAVYFTFDYYSVKVLSKNFNSLKGKSFVVGRYKIEGKKVRWFHEHCSKGLSDILLLLFCFAIMSLVAFPYFSFLAIALYGYFFHMAGRICPPDDSYSEYIYGLPVRRFVEYCSGMLYFVLFLALVVFVYFEWLGVYQSLFSLLFSRMMVQSVQRLLVEGFFINKDLKSCVEEKQLKENA